MHVIFSKDKEGNYYTWGWSHNLIPRKSIKRDLKPKLSRKEIFGITDFSRFYKTKTECQSQLPKW